ncbi:MAG: twin-arginine translocase TatA/TatE family subunit [Bacteroidales bacterium]
MLLFISGQEIFVIFLIVLLLFGANKLPEIARGLGKGVNEFRKATDDIKREMHSEVSQIKEKVEETWKDEESHSEKEDPTDTNNLQG